MSWIKKQKYVLLSQSRSGTQLMRWLMGSHPEIHAEGEVLHHELRLARYRSVLEFSRVYPDPLLYLRAAHAPEPIYGFTLMFYHPHFQLATLKRLSFLGWHVVNLVRENVLDIAWSYLIAEKTGTWHAKNEAPPVDYRVHIAVEELAEELEKRVAWRDRQRELANQVPHLELSYEKDLADSTRWQPACDRIFERLGIEPHPVSAPLRKTDQRPREDVIDNYRELVNWMQGSTFSDLLPESG